MPEFERGTIPPDERVDCLVEADSFAEHKLQLEVIEFQKVEMRFIVRHTLQIGELMERPIVVALGYFELKGKIIVFYECCSMLCDHKMIESWLKDKFRCCRNTRGHFNANNFNNALSALGIYP